MLPPGEPSSLHLPIPTMPSSEEKRSDSPDTPLKDPAAVALGRKGGLKGGKARAEKLSKEDLSRIARLGAKARWSLSEQPADESALEQEKAKKPRAKIPAPEG